MLESARHRITSARKTVPLTFALNSNASVDLSYNRKRRAIHLTLHGVMIGANAAALHKFLRVVAHLAAAQWALQMRDVEVISLRGIRHLMHFAKTLRTRGGKLKILGIHPNVYATLRDLNLLSALGWPAGKSRAPSDCETQIM